MGAVNLVYLLWWWGASCHGCMWVLLVAWHHAIIWYIVMCHQDWRCNGRTVLLWKDLWQQNILSKSHPRACPYLKIEDLLAKSLILENSIDERFHLPLSLQAREDVRELQSLTALVDPTFKPWITGSALGQPFTSSKFYSFCFRYIVRDEAFTWIWKSKCNMR